jgi:prepilin peptidase CpaA
MQLMLCAFMLLLAVAWDVQTHRIPNLLVLGGVLLGWATACLPSGMGLQSATLGSLTGLVVFLPLYLLRILGAGDVKLLTAVGAFVGYPGILTVALFTGLAGGILALLLAIRHRQLKQMWNQVHQGLLGFVMQIASGGRPRQWVMVVGPHRLPYALAIALGTASYVYLIY